MGKPTDYNREKHLQPLLDACEKLFSQRASAMRCGIHEATLRKWLKKGSLEALIDDSLPFAELYIKFRQKQSMVAEVLLKNLMGQDQLWGSKAWLLDRVMYKDYSDKVPVIEYMEELCEEAKAQHPNTKPRLTKKPKLKARMPKNDSVQGHK